MPARPGANPIGTPRGSPHYTPRPWSWNSMRIACPSCDAAYEVPDSRLPRGKMVRCARCDNKWLPAAQADDTVSPPDPAVVSAPVIADSEAASADDAPDAAPAAAPQAPTATAMDRLSASPTAGLRPHRGLIGAWAMTFVVLALAVAAAVVWRNAVVRAWPPSGRILATTDSAPAATPTGQTPSSQTSSGQTSSGQERAGQPPPATTPTGQSPTAQTARAKPQ